MKKSILNLGKILNKKEQKEVNGGSISLSFCETRCKTASRGTSCYSTFSGQSVCDGNGGHIAL